MKTFLISCTMLLASVALMAKTPGPTPDDYVKTKSDVLYYSKLTLSPTKAKLILDNGDKMTLMNNEVVAYKKNGKLFEKMPLYYKNKSTNREVFMEVLKYTNGMKLYRYTTFEQDANLPLKLGATRQIDKYFVFKNGNYHLQIDEANYKTVFGFFGINAIMQ